MNNPTIVKSLVRKTLKGITPKYVAKSNIIVLNQKCIRNNRIDYSFSQFHDPAKKFSEEKILKVGDILINSTGQGTAGRCAFVYELPKGQIVITDSHILIVRVDNFYTAACLEYSLSRIEPILQTFLDGSTGQGEFDKQRFFNISLNLPVSEKQESVYGFLKKIDEKIELNNKINAELEAAAKTLYDYWFVQFDFSDENGKPYKTSGGKMDYNATLKREIPHGWVVKALSAVTPVSTESVNPANYPEKLFKHLSIPSFDANGSFFEEKGGNIGSSKFKVCSTDILVSKLNPKFSRVIYVTNEEDLICSTEFVVWRPDNQKLKPFLYSVAKDQAFKSFCQNSASGTSNSHKRVNPAVMMDYQIAFNQEVCELFGKHIESSIKKMMANNLETKQLMSLRDWLLPMLMNGQVSVLSEKVARVAIEGLEETVI